MSVASKAVSILNQLATDSAQQSQEQVESIEDKQKKVLHDKALELLRINDQLKEFQTVMKQLQARKNSLALQEIPAILDDWNQVGVTYHDLSIDLKFDLYGNFPKVSEDGDTSKVDNAVQELTRIEGGKDIIVNRLTVDFARGKFDSVEEVSMDLIERGFNPVVASTVHHATLKSFVKKRIETTDIDPTLLGLFARHIATVRRQRK